MVDSQIKSSKTNYVQFDNDIVVDTISGLPVGASIGGFIRIVNAPRTSVRDWVDSTTADFETTELEYHTPTGLRRGRIIPFSAFKSGFKKFNPSLLEAASDYGIAAYTLNLAGYTPQPSPTPSPFQIPTTLSEALLLAGKLAGKVDTLEAQIEADSEATALGEFLNKGNGLIGMGEMARILEIGRNRLFIELREMGIMMQGKVIPYQWCHEAGYFKVTETLDNNGEIVMVTLITSKGQKYLAKRHKKFLANEWMVVRVEKELNLA